MTESLYTIYAASAGSGKTSTLVKEYLKILLGSNQNGKFRQMLALTFTNKAVNEMKGRILQNLHEFGSPDLSPREPHMFRELCAELNLEPAELNRKSAQALKEILHNYAYFDISTIDKFTYRLIRTFARDLKLPQNFEVVLNTDLFLEEAIGRLLGRAGTDPGLTRVLVDFALAKIDDEKSWDISRDLFRIGKLLFNENHLASVSRLADKNLKDFGHLKTHIRGALEKLTTSMKEYAADIQRDLQQHGLERGDFSRGYFPDFIDQVLSGEMNKINFNAQWKQAFGDQPLYNKTCPPNTRQTIDGLMPRWIPLFEGLKMAYNQWLLLQNAYANLVPLTVLNEISRELRLLEKERDQLPISSFNSLISNEIRDQPAPFIFERLGEQYQHFFIDEFQDTSILQWSNLIPLISNSLEASDLQGKRGSLLLVGDAKQAIYRWRGGRAEQFIGLVSKATNPFTVEANVTYKPANYRSLPSIVQFNNEFFGYISKHLGYVPYRQLYAEGSAQEAGKTGAGLVTLRFIDPQDTGRDEMYCDSVLGCIREALQAGFAPGDICILTRKRKEGVAVSAFLLEHGLQVLSSETLLLASHPMVAFLLALMQYCQTPADRNAAYEVLSYLAPEDHSHRLIAAHLEDPAAFLRSEYGFEIGYMRHAPAYDGLEYAIRCFRLGNRSDAYLNYLLDTVMEVEKKEDSSINTFLEYWHQEKENVSIVMPEDTDAIRVTTIHKAKGLEFPVVIYPFANTDIHNRGMDRESLFWLTVDPETHSGFDELLLSRKKEVESYNPLAAELYAEETHQLQLDAFNLLYVALTRAEKALYIISEKDLDSKGNPREGKFSGLFIDYLSSCGRWDPDLLSYTFGSQEAVLPSRRKGMAYESVPFLYSGKDSPAYQLVTRTGMLWDTERGKAISRGNLLHELMALVIRRGDLEGALEKLSRQGALRPGDEVLLKRGATAIMDHELLARYYGPEGEVRNECELFTGSGQVLRPDRLVISGRRVTLIDYKTGMKNETYHRQLQLYGEALEQMGLEVENRIIIYINEGVVPEFI